MHPSGGSRSAIRGKMRPRREAQKYPSRSATAVAYLLAAATWPGVFQAEKLLNSCQSQALTVAVWAPR